MPGNVCLIKRVRGHFIMLRSTRNRTMLVKIAENFFFIWIFHSSSVGSLRDREVACSASDCQGWNFEFCVWRTVSSQSSHHPREVLLAQFSLYVHKGSLKPDSSHLPFQFLGRRPNDGKMLRPPIFS